MRDDTKFVFVVAGIIFTAAAIFAAVGLWTADIREAEREAERVAAYEADPSPYKDYTFSEVQELPVYEQAVFWTAKCTDAHHKESACQMAQTLWMQFEAEQLKRLADIQAGQVGTEYGVLEAES